MYTKEIFYKKCELKHDNKFTYYDDFNGVNGGKIKIKCKICNHENFVFASNHIKGAGCAKCYGNNKLDISDNTFCERLNINYMVCIDDYKNNSSYLTVRCKKCEIIFKQRIHNMLVGHIGCDCKIIKSKPVQEIEKYLKTNNIEYYTEHRFKDCRYLLPLPFDFYLPSYNLCIEYDGEQHYMTKSCFGGDEEYEKTQIRDNIKNNYCKDNNIDMLRIPYFDFKNIETILLNKLNPKLE